MTQPITIIPFSPNGSKSGIFSRIELFERDDLPSTWRQQAYETAWTKAQNRLTALAHELYQPTLSSLKTRIDLCPTHLLPATALDGTSLHTLTTPSKCKCLLGILASGTTRSFTGTESITRAFDTGSLC